MNIYRKALETAEKEHAGQTDLYGFPYILHPVRVASMFSGNDEMMSIAVLHDVLEDSDIRHDFFKERFGSFIFEQVSILTRPKNKDYFAYIHDISLSETLSLVKISDLLDNMKPSRNLFTNDVPAINRNTEFFIENSTRVNFASSRNRLRKYMKALALLSENINEDKKEEMLDMFAEVDYILDFWKTRL